jgi:hypothetical protein
MKKPHHGRDFLYNIIFTRRIFVKISTAISTLPGIEEASQAVMSELQSKLGNIDLCILFATVEYNIEKLSEIVSRECEEVKIHGGTSCQGLMAANGFFSDEGRAIGAWAISDPDGAYGIGYADIGDDPQVSAAKAITMALEDAERPGEAPNLIFMTTAPGYEEDVIKGIEQVVGTDVPIAGGSSADNTIAGEWKQFTNGRVLENGIILAALFPSVSIEVGVSFSSGYVPTNKSGIVTKAERRTLYEIDNKPAAHVYNEWTKGAIDQVLSTGGTILQSSTLYPIGREVGKLGSVPFYMLSHPESVGKGGTMNLFTEVEEGDKLELMTGSLESLYTRAGRVAGYLLENELQVKEITGAFIVYCAGCMLTVGDKMNEVVKGIKENIPGIPFMGVFTFGEQGCFKNGENHHGNLMITVIMFGRK